MTALCVVCSMAWAWAWQVAFFSPRLGMVSKPAGTMGAKVLCPASWSPAGMPPGIYEALHCTVSCPHFCPPTVPPATPGCAAKLCALKSAAASRAPCCPEYIHEAPR